MSHEIIARINKNKKKNAWWLKLFQAIIVKILLKLEFPQQTIGVFLNHSTSNNERYRLLSYFIKKKYKHDFFLFKEDEKDR